MGKIARSVHVACYAHLAWFLFGVGFRGSAMANQWSGPALIFAVGLAVSAPASVFATNGYFSHGSSVAEKGLAGAGVAYSQDTLAASNNPAGMVWQGARYVPDPHVVDLAAEPLLISIASSPQVQGARVGGRS